MCVCVCVCVCVLLGPVKPELGVIPSGQVNHSRVEHLNFPGRELNVINFTEQTVIYIYIYIYIYRLIGLVNRVFANGPGDDGSIPGRVIPKTLKRVLDTSLLNTQRYEVRIKGKVEQSRERSSVLSYTSWFNPDYRRVTIQEYLTLVDGYGQRNQNRRSPSIQ